MTKHVVKLGVRLHRHLAIPVHLVADSVVRHIRFNFFWRKNFSQVVWARGVQLRSMLPQLIIVPVTGVIRVIPGVCQEVSVVARLTKSFLACLEEFLYLVLLAVEC